MTAIASTLADQCAHLDSLIREVSSVLCRQTESAFPTTIERILQQIVEATDVDRGTVIEASALRDKVEAAYGWARPPAVDNDVHTEAPRLRQMLEWLGGGDIVVMRYGPAAAAGGPPAAVKSAIAIPATVEGRVTALTLEAYRTQCEWNAQIVDRMRRLCKMFAAAMYRLRQQRTVHQGGVDLTRLSVRINLRGAERAHVNQATRAMAEIVGTSDAVMQALDRVRLVSGTDSAILLLGETGTGKELFARAVHANSRRRHLPLITVNCAALPAGLVESELFGHQRGAFTGAVSDRQGRFELADRGTLFLDEIGDLPLEIQAKLLRVLQDQTFERLGSSHTRKVDVRIIAATHRNLQEAVAAGQFRADLYYRLSVFPIQLPPLRDRREDIPALVWAIINRRQEALQRSISHVPPEVMFQLQDYDWPGNIRELENAIERALIRSETDTMTLDDDLTVESRPTAAATTTLQSVERSHIQQVLGECRWRINGNGNAAERLGIHPNTLRFRMKKLGITRSSLSPPSRLHKQNRRAG